MMLILFAIVVIVIIGLDYSHRIKSSEYECLKEDLKCLSHKLEEIKEMIDARSK